MSELVYDRAARVWRSDDPTLASWHFTMEEISYGRWRVEGRHPDGRSVGRIGSERALGECADDARSLPEKRHA